MKRNIQNRISTEATRRAKTRRLPIGVPAKRNQAIAGEIICVVIVLHFAAQFVFFPREKFQSHITSAKTTEAQENAKIETADGAENSRVKETTMLAAPIAQKTPKTLDAPRAVIKKKEPPRESRAERLRRAEKILTGV